MFELERSGRKDLMEDFADTKALMKGRRFKLGVWRQTVALESCEPIAVDFAFAVRSGTYVLCDRGMEKTSVSTNRFRIGYSLYVLDSKRFILK